mgnify:CR=1 FL=1
MFNDRVIQNLYEVIEGEKIMSPSPAKNHAYIMNNIFFNIQSYLRGKKFGRVFTDNMDVHLPDGNIFRPDLFVVCDRKTLKQGRTVYGVPDFAVEILSHSSKKMDVTTKKDIYEKNGVKEYWIVNPWEKSVTVYVLHDGKFDLEEIYMICPEEEFNEMDDEEKAAIKTDIKLSIFDDLTISVEDIFFDIED